VIEYARPQISETKVIAELILRSWRHAFAGIVPAEVLATETVEGIEAHWQRHVANPERLILAAYDGQVLIGITLYGQAEPRQVPQADGHITSLYVDQRFHGQCIGKSLITRAAREWLMCGGESLSVGVLKENVKARAFYEATGAVLHNEGVFRWHGQDLAEIIYHYADLKSLAANAV
jgi:ribosomal protein S18 acetylase RimI-like enzyme